jgi:HK97 family phage prohead protease
MTIKRNIIGSVRFTRAEDTDEMPKEFGGEAAIINTRTNLGYFEEEIAQGAFDEALADATVDIRVLFNHRDSEILGRTKALTAKVFVNDKGNLEYSWIPDYENPLHKQVSRSIMRGDITQSSFQFTIKSQEWIYDDQYAGGVLRRITKIERLYDVAPVTFPAYEEATAEARSLAKQELDKAKDELNQNVTSEKQNENKRSLDLLKVIKTKHSIK